VLGVPEHGEQFQQVKVAPSGSSGSGTQGKTKPRRGVVPSALSSGEVSWHRKCPSAAWGEGMAPPWS